jgi:hypothetical protein
VVIDTRSDHRSVELTDGVRLGSAGGNGLVGMLLDCVPMAQTADHIFLASGVVAVCAILTQSSVCGRHSPGSTGIKSSIFEEGLIRKWSKPEPAFTITAGLP